MSFNISPGVYWREWDLTTGIAGVSTTVGAFAGDFDWGPINKIVTVSSQDNIAAQFGVPSANTYLSFFSAANFLDYGLTLRLVRAANTAVAKNAVSGATPILIKDRDDYENNYRDGQAANTSGMFAARYAGDKGNGLVVSAFVSANANAYANWAYADNFNGVPGTSVWTGSKGGANDEIHVVVLDGAGKFTGVANTVLERFPYISKASDAKNDDGTSNYWVNVLNDRSKYIYAINPPDETNNWGQTSILRTFTQNTDVWTNTLSGGKDAYANTGQFIQAFDKFRSAEDVDVSLLITGHHNQTVAEYVVEDIAEVRRDCVAFISPDQSDVVLNAGNEVTDIVAKRNMFNSSSYAVMDSNWKYQFDKYNNVYRWIPCNPDVAGLCALTDKNRDPWYSPAGFNRGSIKNVTKLAWNPGESERDDLYKASVNPIVSFVGDGVVLYGDKTMLAKPSAFDRINVRRLFIVLEKAISQAAKYSLFEFNDEFTRASFVALVEPYLRDVQGRRGIYDFKVVCDTTNNTPDVIDQNQFIGDIYIKPAKSISYIQLNFVAVRTSVSFDEVVGKYGGS